MNRLPEKFEARMKELLKDEFHAFLESFAHEPMSGLRVNTMKLDKEQFEAISPCAVTPIPWISNGFFYNADVASPAKHPYYYAGLYYIQEPSAMTPAAVLPIEKGDRVLDLCAAPGGKSTELAARLNGEGVLVSNDISNSRAKALLKNLELFGTKNAIIVSESPQKLSERFYGYFDKILVDAPCSGEGMFRKSPSVMKNWEQYGVSYYQRLQREILPFAVKMLRPGGMLVYSTCTFSPEEDEDTLRFLLSTYPELSVVRPTLQYEGFANAHPEWVDGPEGIRNAIRIWPHRMEGEGHFIAMLQKSESADDASAPLVRTPATVKRSSQRTQNRQPQASMNKDRIPAEVTEFLSHIKLSFDYDRMMIRGSYVYYLPEGLPDLSGLRILRSGLLLGELKTNRFEPSQALACALKAEEYDNCYDLKAEDEDVVRYLKCETIMAKKPVKDGYVLFLVDGFPLGFLKASNGVLKNKYLPGWRMM